MEMDERLLTDEEMTRNELPDGDYDITGLCQAQDAKTVSITMPEVTIQMIEVFLTAFKQDKRKKVATQIYNAMFTIGYRRRPP